MRTVLLLAVLAFSSLVGCSPEMEPSSSEPVPDAAATTPDTPSSPDAPDAPELRTVDIEGPDVLPHVQAFANAVCTALDACTISTYEGHSPTAAQAIDILISDEYGQLPSDNNAFGDSVAQFALDHYTEYGMMYVIFRQRIHYSTGDWHPMEDRGSITQNHFDHVHVSFNETL